MPKYDNVITTICALSWDRLSNDEVLQVAKAYYYFSIQFRENLEIACQLRPAIPSSPRCAWVNAIPTICHPGRTSPLPAKSSTTTNLCAGSSRCSPCPMKSPSKRSARII